MADSFTVSGNDHSYIVLRSVKAVVVSNSEASDRLQIHGVAGNDTIDALGLEAGAATPEFDGGGGKRQYRWHSGCRLLVRQ